MIMHRKTHESHKTLDIYVLHLWSSILVILILVLSALNTTEIHNSSTNVLCFFFSPASYSYRKCVLVPGTFYLLTPLISTSSEDTAYVWESEKTCENGWWNKGPARKSLPPHLYPVLNLILSPPPRFLPQLLSSFVNHVIHAS